MINILTPTAATALHHAAVLGFGELLSMEATDSVVTRLLEAGYIYPLFDSWYAVSQRGYDYVETLLLQPGETTYRGFFDYALAAKAA